MIVPFQREQRDTWDAIRARMLRETEVFLEDGLRSLEVAVRIPAIPVGSGSFSEQYARSFWVEVLGLY